MKSSRLMIAAPKSGSGKTLLTCALLGALKKLNKDVMAFKSGPDYIDPMFHRRVQEIPCENLDPFLLGEDKVKDFFAGAASGHEICVIEGAMGIFDGTGVKSDKGSAYDVARLTKTPVILIVDVHGMGRSMIPFIKGFADYDREGLIKGVILNRISDMFFGQIKPVLERELKIPLLGYFPKRNDMDLESRHLGLKLPGEVESLKDLLDAAARQFLSTVDMDALLNIAEGAEVLEDTDNTRDYERIGEGLTLAVAADEAFCFYYDANIRLFKKMGVAVKVFSPIRDKGLPKGADGFLLGGGYPELYLKELSLNHSMRSSVKAAIEAGVPSLAECGGFMYLHKWIRDEKGEEYEMVGAIDGKAENKGKLVRFGYVNISEERPCFLKVGETIRAHEFHYYDSTNNGGCCIAEKPGKGRSWSCIHEDIDHFWGFPHLYYLSAPEFVVSFINRMRKYSEGKSPDEKYSDGQCSDEKYSDGQCSDRK